MELIIILSVFICIVALIWYLSKRAHGKDDAVVVENIRRSAMNGDVYAQFKLANIYFEGRGVEQDDVEAAGWFLKAAQQDHVEAQFILGTLYEKGDGVGRDDAQAYQWFSNAASQGHNRSIIMLESDKWQEYIRKHNSGRDGRGDQIDPDREEITSEHVEKYTQKAGQGDVDAQYNLAIMYYHGEGVERNLEEALYWFHKAAEQDDTEAQYNLGFMYGRGEGIRRDQEQSMQWFMKAAQQGHAGAQEIVGKMLKKP
ncbi:MAG TPA: sel1 repeat family protein [Deltaproteobacteria bacterium]|nr:sel1 repeat family protein [Deltaproteobacteria bacterium]